MTSLLAEHRKQGCSIPKGKRTCYWCGKRQPPFNWLRIAFRNGMTRRQVSRKFGVAIEVVDRALRGAL